jgi:hypothetical protein
MNTCPKCRRKDRKNRAWKTRAVGQRFERMYSRIKYTPNPKPWVYDDNARQKALGMYVDGMNLRRIGRHPARSDPYIFGYKHM